MLILGFLLLIVDLHVLIVCAKKLDIKYFDLPAPKVPAAFFVQNMKLVGLSVLLGVAIRMIAKG
jgi:hypothetical protein